jgi:uncharacterized membrane protein
MRRWLLPILFGLLLGVFAQQATLLAMPRLLMAAADHRLTRIGGANRMTAIPLVTAGERIIVRPSPDLAYSTCPFDLAGGPILVEAAPVPSPYWSVSVFDPRTDTVFVRNNRDSKGAGIRFAIARPDQAVPAGIEAVRIDGNRGIALIRILVVDRAGFAPLDRARRASRCGRIG